jgi:hypothetical protein
MQKRLAIVGLTAGLVGGSLAGFTLAGPGLAGAESAAPSTSTPSTSTPSTSTPSTGAGAASPTRPDPAAPLRQALDPLVANGTITQAQEDAVVAALQSARPDRAGFSRMGADLDAAAKVLGVTADELRTDLDNGQSLAQIAQAKGVDPQAVIDALVAEVKGQLDSRVASGDLTQAQADQRLSDVTDRITKFVNGELPAERGHHEGPGPWGPDGDRGARSGSGSTDPNATPNTTPSSTPGSTPSSTSSVTGSSTGGSGI